MIPFHLRVLRAIIVMLARAIGEPERAEHWLGEELTVKGG